ncbi:hypothetical protein CN918_27360 [Priestia megaterium]|nr:hypothetical protein CN918_27360 [Priestia megaterium]
MKKWVIVFVAVSILSGCSISKEVKAPHVNSEELHKGTDKLLQKVTKIPIEYQKGTFTLWDVIIGEDVNTAKTAFGEPEKETDVPNFWRYDTIYTYHKDRLQIDMALFHDQIDEISITIPKDRKVAWNDFARTFNDREFVATDVYLNETGDNKSIHYYVNEAEDQWLVVQEKKDGSTVISNTFTYDFTDLFEKKKIQEKLD